MSKLKKRQIHKNSKKKISLTKEIPIETSNFSVSTMAARTQWDSIFKMLREHVNIKLCYHSL